MIILDYIERDLNSHYYDNVIYSLAESEKDKYEEIKRLLESDYGYLDIVLNFDDYDKLKPLFEQLPKNEIERNIIKNMIISDYLSYSILSKANIDTLNYNISVSKIGENLFGGNINNYIDAEDLFFSYDVCEPLKKKAQTKKHQKARVHFLLDYVEDVRLQKCINDLFAYRSDIAMMGYITKELLTYQTIQNGMIENVHDYIEIMSEEKQKIFTKKIGGM